MPSTPLSLFTANQASILPQTYTLFSSHSEVWKAQWVPCMPPVCMPDVSSNYPTWLPLTLYNTPAVWTFLEPSIPLPLCLLPADAGGFILWQTVLTLTQASLICFLSFFLFVKEMVTYSSLHLQCLVWYLVYDRCSVIVCLMKVNIIKKCVLPLFSFPFAMFKKINLYIA